MIRKERIKWLIGLLVNHDMEEIIDRFYELISKQSREFDEADIHPYEVDWQKYDHLYHHFEGGELK